MKKLKKSPVIFISFIIVLLCCLTSCNENNENTKNISNYYLPDNSYKLNNLSFVDKITKTDDNIFIHGEIIQEYQHRKLLQSLDMNDGSITDIGKDTLEKIEGNINGVFTLGKNIFFSYMNNDRINMVTVINKDTGEVLHSLPIENSESLTGVYRIDDNRIRMIFSKYGMYGMSVSEKVFYEDTLELISQKELGYSNSMYTILFLCDRMDGYLWVDSNGDDKSIIFSIKKIDFEGNEIYRSDDIDIPNEEALSVFMNTKGNVCIIARDENNDLFIAEYDKNNGQVSNTYELTDINCLEVFKIYSGKYDFIYSCPDGIYGYNLTDDNTTKIIDDNKPSDKFYYNLKSTEGSSLILYSEYEIADRTSKSVLKLDKNGDEADIISFEPSNEECDVLCSAVIDENLYCYAEGCSSDPGYKI